MSDLLTALENIEYVCRGFSLLTHGGAGDRFNASVYQEIHRSHGVRYSDFIRAKLSDDESEREWFQQVLSTIAKWRTTGVVMQLPPLTELVVRANKYGHRAEWVKTGKTGDTIICNAVQLTNLYSLAKRNGRRVTATGTGRLLDGLAEMKVTLIVP